MKTSALRFTLISLVGTYIFLMGYILPYAASPLLTITGVGLLIYAGLLFFREPDEKSTASSTVPAGACLDANHAGCQDDPECVCGCHRERIEVMIPSL